MCSFDVTNLYTNIPLQKIIDVILSYLFFSTKYVVFRFIMQTFFGPITVSSFEFFLCLQLKIVPSDRRARNGPTTGSDFSKYLYVSSRTEVVPEMP